MSIITSYIIYPLLGILLIGLGFLIAKKNNLSNNKKLIAYLLICILALSLPALLGLLDYDFMPYGYIGIGVLYLVLGYYNTKIITWLFKDKPPYYVEVSILLFTLLGGAFLFSLIFNMCNELEYGLWASTSLLAFTFPSIYIKSAQLFLDIPVEVYKVWMYDKSQDITNDNTIDYNQLKVVKMELFKQEHDSEPVTINAKAPYDMAFGIWFKRLLTDYNIKSPLSPIDPNNGSEGTGWIFYTKPSFFLPRNYIDYDKTFTGNKISERHTIIAKRVKESTEQQ
ncbi:TssN family type VI secretion system protein [Saccharicrinis fermentans]|nr:TssN family type VI secretion system protein [Saccharicrinis fermentans]